MIPTPHTVTVPSSASPVFDGSQGTAFELTLTTDATAPLFVNFSPGVRYALDIGQDAAGGHLFVWSSNTANMAEVNAAPNIRTTQLVVIGRDGTLFAATAAILNQG